MKKIVMFVLMLMFIVGNVWAFDMPESRYNVPNVSKMHLLGEQMVTQKMRSGGTISMKGYQKGDTQFVKMTFKGEERPYCWWFADTNTAYSEGRCDVDNDGKYEYDFNSTGSTGKRLFFKPKWPTAYE